VCCVFVLMDALLMSNSGVDVVFVCCMMVLVGAVGTDSSSLCL
jgi:hypothetical protein